MTYAIPSDTHSPGDPNCTPDLNNAWSTMGLLARAIAQVTGAGLPDPAGNAANVATIQAFIATGRSIPGVAYNVKDTAWLGGAKGDGATDDTAALQYAVNTAAAVNGSLLFPDGTYMASALLEIPHAMGLYGHAKYENGLGGTVIQQVPGSNLNALLATVGWQENAGTHTGSVVLDRLFFLGEGAPLSSGGSTQTAGEGNLVVLQSFGAVVNKCYFQGAYGDACRFDAFGMTQPAYSYTAPIGGPITATGSAYTVNEQVVLSGSPPAPLVAGTTYYVTAPSGSQFQLSATSGGAAITLTGSGSGTVTAVPLAISSADNCKFTGNIVAGAGGDGFSCGVGTLSSVASDGFCTDNQFSAIYGAGGIHFGNSADWIIASNHLYGIQQSGVVAGRMSDVLLFNNRIDTFGQSATAGTYFGIDAGYTQFNTADGNIIAKNRVKLQDTTPGNLSSTLHGIGWRCASGQESSVSVEGNTVRLGSATGAWAGTAYLFGSQSGTSVPNLDMRGNNAIGPWSAYYKLPGASGTTVRGDVNSSASLYPPVAATYTSGTAAITGTNSFAAGDTVVWTAGAPGGFTTGTVYYVISAGLSSTAFELSATSGGAAITPSSGTAGTLRKVTVIGGGGTVTVTGNGLQATTKVTVTAAPGLGGTTPAAVPYVSAQATGSFTVTGTAGSIVHWTATEW